jgi:hypothetical protein
MWALRLHIAFILVAIVGDSRSLGPIAGALSDNVYFPFFALSEWGFQHLS